MVEIKQYSPNNNLTLFPRSGRWYMVRHKENGEFITGLSQEQEERLGKQIGENLSTTSPYWKDYLMKFHLPDLTMKVDDKTADGEIFLTVAQANRLLAPDLDTYLEDMKYKNNTIFYIHDVEKQEKVKFKFLSLKAETTKLVHDMRNDKDKMLFILYKLGRYVLSTLPTEGLYNMMIAELEKRTKFHQMEEFKNVLSIKNEELQAYYYAKQAIKMNIIRFSGDTKMYTFQDKAIANNEEGVIKELSKKPNELTLAMIINEVLDHTANK